MARGRCLKWCLKCGGLGGFGRRDVAGIGLVYESYCDCPRGVEHQAFDEAKSAGGLEDQRRWAWHVSGIPAILYDATLSSSPHSGEPVASKMRYPPSASFVEDAPWKAAVREWRRGWFLHGPVGVGKSGLAAGYMREWIWSGQGRARWVTVPNLLAEIRSTYGPPREGKRDEADVVYAYAEAPLLVMDDLGSERMMDANMEWVQDVLLRIVGNRHDGLMTTVFTSNYSLEALERRVSERLTWRILEMCSQDHVVEVTGRNLRKDGAV